MTEVLILIDIEARGLVDTVMEKLGKIEEIKCVAFITGPHDFMAIADGDMQKIITEIRKIEEVEDTTTNVVVADHVSKGLEKKF